MIHPTPAGLARRPRALIVDNDEVNVELLTEICEMEGLEVMVAQDGDAALEVLGEHLPDLVMLDVMMPQRDGFEVLQEIRNRPATRLLPVLMITAVADDDSIRRGYRLGANDYITKPFKIAELVARMRTLVRASAFQRAADSPVQWEVGDRHSLDEQLHDHLATAPGRPLSLIMVEVEGLAPVARQDGGAAAAHLSSRVAHHLRHLIRGVDSAHLYEPDLVALVLPGTGHEAAEAVTRRLEEDLALYLAREQLDHLSHHWASASWSSPDLSHVPRELLERCLRALGRQDGAAADADQKPRRG